MVQIFSVNAERLLTSKPRTEKYLQINHWSTGYKQLGKHCLIQLFLSGVRWGKKRKNKKETETSHLDSGGGRSHLVSNLLKERTLLSILFSSKAEHASLGRECWCVCVCTWRLGCVLGILPLFHTILCVRTYYKTLSFTYRALGPQEVSGL